ncbi:uncharacterized protein K460DRAFT_410239 [Cucurbitaria berberidis CBS 394.84]|uniref:Uncharacterized protein n=1 Tax=Cucurbitaria berberidis CBS 394.84 TaxID=1168544 RepID=A0A9P4G857_9PLEO|nr:uncharacterized protein K460DRAFT_410239 [Cucurbitaria berberidis CBS 394.84]KAF1840838.1 hypothetical protein K460DRAFT_410239 [Cucurbitaria berberidis CBS 394.84]
MPVQPDDLLLSLQSSLRNALSTFGPNSSQYRNIQLMVDEHMAKTALANLTISSHGPRQQDDQKV